MKNEKFREELNMTSGADIPSEEEIAAVEAMYLATLDAEIPDIWDRIEAGINAPSHETRTVMTGGAAGNAAYGTTGSGSTQETGGKVISLAERRRKKKTLFAVIGTAAAILIVMIPTVMLGGTRNSKKTSDSGNSPVHFSEDGENYSIGTSGSDNKQQYSRDSYGNTANDAHEDVQLADDKDDKDSLNLGGNDSQATESTTTAGFDEFEDEKYTEFFEDGKVYQIKTEGELYLSDDFKIILETPSDSKYEIVNIETFSEPVIAELKKGGRIEVWIKGDFDGDESDRRVIISEYREVDR